MPVYRTSSEHLFEELRRLDLILNLEIARQRADPQAVRFNEFRGLFIAEDEIDPFVDEKAERRLPDKELEARLSSLAQEIARAERTITENVAESHTAGLQLALPQLARLFELSPFDIDTLLVCLAPELNVKYEKLYAYLQNDVTRRRPTTDLVLNLFCRSLYERLQARTRLLCDAPLIKHELVHATSEGTEHTTLLSRALKIDERIFNFLLGVETIDERIASFAHVSSPQVELAQVLLAVEVKKSLVACFMNEIESKRRRDSVGATLFILQAGEGAGKNFVTESLCREAGRELVTANGPALLLSGSKDLSLVTRLFREASLRNAVVFIDQADVLVGEGEKENQVNRALFEALRAFDDMIVIVGARESWGPPWLSNYERRFKFTFPIPDFALRKEVWRSALAESGNQAADIDPDQLADRFNFTPGRIHNAVAEAHRLTLSHGLETRPLNADDLNQACRAQSGSKLPALARKIKPIFNWNDIILPNDCLEQLREVCTHIRHRQRVFSEWGFDGKISLGKGLGVLFVGASGTGKTMAAEIIASELALDLYKIDLSCVVSKYIGETEKNLSHIFAEAEASNAVLFFDEADAIFGKRSEVKDSHDRYANIEINYLLQKMEEYEGIVILASNFQKNIDEAFTRRLRFIIEFPFPEKEYRRRIWQKVFPTDTPLAGNIDFDFLAHKLKVSGGNIRNIALSAAFLGAGNSGHVGMEHIVCAAKREFQKMGRLCVRSDFDQYFELIETEGVAS